MRIEDWRDIDANPGDRGLPGFCPAVHLSLRRSSGSSRTWRSAAIAEPEP